MASGDAHGFVVYSPRIFLVSLSELLPRRLIVRATVRLGFVFETLSIPSDWHLTLTAAAKLESLPLFPVSCAAMIQAQHTFHLAELDNSVLLADSGCANHLKPTTRFYTESDPRRRK